MSSKANGSVPPGDPSAFEGVPRAGLRFLRRLERNNEREWFQAHHATYRTELREPMLALAAAVNPRLERFAPAYVMPPGRAVTAINRDPRFAREGAKTYKGWLALAFRRPGTILGTGASFYVSVSPREVRIRCGLPVATVQAGRALRAHIVDAYVELKTILRRQGLKNAFDGVFGDRYRRVPPDVPDDHPATSLLLYKSLYAEAILEPAVSETRGLVQEVVRRFRAAAPLVHFIDAALLDVAPASVRAED
ncbi:MAG: DUF2461 domain-containing protein [Planctomycetota bacterium]|nr:DUF2461 domain-containing protein [Planctomycetota bacterium]